MLRWKLIAGFLARVMILRGLFLIKLGKYLRSASAFSLVLIFCTGPGDRAPSTTLFEWLVPAAAAAGPDDADPIDVTPGLMWNRSGLPAIFPLQVKTPADSNYFLTLADVETGKEVLGAFIIGGEFFKVLVPPGTFAIRFSTGKTWQGEARMFGPGTMTTVAELEHPLTFKITGFGRKEGHLVDLTGNAPGQIVTAEVKGQSICQTLDTEIVPPWEYWYHRKSRRYRWENSRTEEIEIARTLDRYRYRYSFPRYFSDRVFYPQYTVRSRFCD